MGMRLHIVLGDDTVAEIDRLAGPRGRSAFIREAVEAAVDRQRRREAFERSAGSIHDFGRHLGRGWVRRERRADPRRVG